MLVLGNEAQISIYSEVIKSKTIRLSEVRQA